jgi:hypothetical protein
MRLFFNSRTQGKGCLNRSKRLANNILFDGLFNALLLSSFLAELGLFSWEFQEQVIEGNLINMKHGFLSFIGFTLSSTAAVAYLGHEGQKLIKVVSKIFSEEKSNLCMHSYLNQEQFMMSLLYFLGSTFNATVHGLSRYQVMQDICDDMIDINPRIMIVGSFVSAANRLATLCLEEKELSNEDEKEETALRVNESRKYDSAQHAKDLLYEAFFILWIGLGAQIQNHDYAPTIAISGVIAGVSSEAMIEMGRAHGWIASASFDKIDVLIDIVVVPILTAEFWMYRRELFVAFFSQDDHWMVSAAPVIMSALIVRHLLKKGISLWDIKEFEPDMEQPHDVPETPTENTPLARGAIEALSEAVEAAPAPEAAAISQKSYGAIVSESEPAEPDSSKKSCCDRIKSRITQCYSTFFKSKESHAPQQLAQPLQLQPELPVVNGEKNVSNATRAVF